jgi:hypothetical protein
VCGGFLPYTRDGERLIPGPATIAPNPVVAEAPPHQPTAHSSMAAEEEFLSDARDELERDVKEWCSTLGWHRGNLSEIVPWDLLPSVDNLELGIFTEALIQEASFVLSVLHRNARDRVVRDRRSYLSHLSQMPKICLILKFVRSPRSLGWFLGSNIDDESLPLSENDLLHILRDEHVRSQFLTTQYQALVRPLAPGGGTDYKGQEVVPLRVMKTLGSGGFAT